MKNNHDLQEFAITILQDLKTEMMQRLKFLESKRPGGHADIEVALCAYEINSCKKDIEIVDKHISQLESKLDLNKEI